MPVRLVILGGGPAGNTAATVAATLGADVTVIEREIVGGAAHLRDCIPSKAMIATGGALAELTRAQVMGLSAEGRLDLDALRLRVASIENRLHASVCNLLESQGVRIIRGTGVLKGPHTVMAETEHEAREKYRRTVSSDRFVQHTLQLFGSFTDIDFSVYELDQPLPKLTTNGEQGSLDAFQQWGSGKTLRELVADGGETPGRWCGPWCSGCWWLRSWSRAGRRAPLT